MATKVITTVLDDIDGSEGAKTYWLISPANNERYEVDLNDVHAKELAEALAPFLAAARRASGAQTAPRTASKSSGRQTRQYDKAGFRKWAEANDKWTGKRPSHDLIDEYEAATR